MPSRFYLRLIQVSLLLQVFLTAGCQDSPTDPTGQNPPSVASIRVEPESPRIILGQLTQLVAVPLDQDGAPVSGLTTHWSSDRPHIVEVTTSGQAIGHVLGIANVTVRTGGREHTAIVQVVEIPAVAVTLSVLDTTLVAGAEFALTATVRDSLHRPLIDRAVVWHTDNAAVATVADNGRVTAVGEGVATVRAAHHALPSTISASMTVRVLANLDGYLLMVSTDHVAGGPRIYRTDLRDTPQSIVPWQTAALSTHPAVSPDGQRVAYTCPEDGTTRGSAICVAQANGTNVQVLTGGDAYYEDEPTWSPDGTRIAFRRWAATFGWPGWTIPTDIWVMDADGGNQANLTNDTTSQHEPAWSPVPVGGAYRIAFLEEEILNGSRSTWVASMRTDGSDRRDETTGAPRFESAPTWSPDGSRILFSRGPVGLVGELYAVDVSTGVADRFLPVVLAGGQNSPAWSPNGEYLAFSSAHDAAGGHDWQVYTVRADGTGLTRRTSGGAGRNHLVWVPTP
jgi:Tol biopolymer transport system component